MKKMILGSILAISMSASTAIAGVCDYTPSNLIGSGATGVVSGAAGTAAAAGAGMQAAGLYSITTAGGAMIGSTAAGASAAGTVGIIGGTAGFLGGVAAVLLSPVVIGVGAVTAIGTAAFEGGCYLAE